MRTKLALVIALLFALTGVLAWQRQGVLALKKQVTSLTSEVVNKNDALREQAALLDRLQQENDVYSKEFASLREKVSTRVSPDTGPSSSSSKNGTTKMFSRMAEDPKMKEVTRQWQSARLKQIYGDFVRARHLGPQQSKQFFDLLVKDDSRAKDEDATLFGDEGLEAQLAAQKAEIDRQLRMLLGDNDYAEYEAYKWTARDRSTLLQIRERLGSTSTPLSDDQANTLLQIMMEERASAPPVASDADRSESKSNREKFAAFLEYTEQYYEAQMDRNQRIRNRLETILSPEQSHELERFQNEYLEMDRVRVETAREMIGRQNDGVATPTVVSTPAP
jgi:hypothetical protein